MSHIAQVDLEVHDLDSLAAAAARLGLEFVRDQATYRWFGQSIGDYPLPTGFTAEDLGRCDHAIRLSPAADPHGIAYEIGVVRRRDGEPGHILLWDFWQGGYGLQAVVGEGCCLLKQEYAAEMARREMALEGFAVAEEMGEDGLVRLRFTR